MKNFEQELKDIKKESKSIVPHEVFKTDLSLQKNEIMVQQIRHNTDFFKESPHKGDVYSMDQQFLSDLSAQIDSAKPSMPKAKIAVTPKPETYESEP